MTASTEEFFRSERVSARRFTMQDLDAFVAYRADPDIAAYQSWTDYTRDQGQRLIESMQDVEPGAPGEWFQIALQARASGDLVGDVALHVQADDPRQAEVGFTLAPAHQGRGLATEALGAYLAWLFDTLELHRVFAVTDALNLRAATLLERVGMRREAHHVENVFFKGAWGSEYVYAVLRREWRTKSGRTQL